MCPGCSTTAGEMFLSVRQQLHGLGLWRRNVSQPSWSTTLVLSSRCQQQSCSHGCGCHLPAQQIRENQTIVAVELLLCSLRALNIDEIRDLEQKTAYGQQIGFDEGLHQPEQCSTQTLWLLQGLACVRQSEVEFGHHEFRDLIRSSGSTRVGDSPCSTRPVSDVRTLAWPTGVWITFLRRPSEA